MVIFASLGTNILDATFEVPLAAVELNVELATAGVIGYTVIDRAVGMAARNLRHSFVIYVEGFVAKDDMVQFDTGLEQRWSAIDSGENNK